MAGELAWHAALAEFHAYRDADLLPRYDLMIRRRPHGLEPEEFEFFWREVGRSAAWSEQFVNMFTHAVPLSAVFNAAAVERFRASIAPLGRAA